MHILTERIPYLMAEGMDHAIFSLLAGPLAKT